VGARSPIREEVALLRAYIIIGISGGAGAESNRSNRERLRLPAPWGHSIRASRTPLLRGLRLRDPQDAVNIDFPFG